MILHVPLFILLPGFTCWRWLLWGQRVLDKEDLSERGHFAQPRKNYEFTAKEISGRSLAGIWKALENGRNFTGGTRKWHYLPVLPQTATVKFIFIRLTHLKSRGSLLSPWLFLNRCFSILYFIVHSNLRIVYEIIRNMIINVELCGNL